jgi:hypothetical protein
MDHVVDELRDNIALSELTFGTAETKTLVSRKLRAFMDFVPMEARAPGMTTAGQPLQFLNALLGGIPAQPLIGNDWSDGSSINLIFAPGSTDAATGTLTLTSKEFTAVTT